MEPYIFLGIGVLLFFAKLFGEVSRRIGVSSLVGEVVAGIFVAMLGIVSIGPFISELAGLGIILILFLAGLMIKFEDIEKQIYTASALAIGGDFLSFLLVFAASMLLTGSFLVSLVIGIIFISTDNGAMMRMLEARGMLKTKIGKMIVATSIADDVVSILSLSFFMMYIVLSNVVASEIVKLFFISIGFYLFIFTFGSRIANIALKALPKFLMDEYIFVSLPLAIALLVSIFSDNLGLGTAAGAFLAGMIVSKSKFAETVIAPKIEVIGNGFLIPLFFAYIGTVVLLSEINILAVAVLLAAALAGKYVGSGILSRAFGFNNEESRIVGIGLMPRGDYSIIISQISISLGVITVGIYSSIILAVILTILITPVLMKISVRT